MRRLTGIVLLLAAAAPLSGCSADEGSSSTDRGCVRPRGRSRPRGRRARPHEGDGELYDEDVEAYGRTITQTLDVIAAGATESDAAEATLDLLDARVGFVG